VVSDPEPDGPPSAIRTYIECLREIPPEATHRLVVQDDAQPHPEFRARAERALRERQEPLVAFFVPGMGLHGRHLKQAAKEQRDWIELPRAANWVPTVALAWPRELAEAFVPFAEEHVARRAARRMHTMGDDPVVGSFARAHGLTVWATVPCLVEHPDTVPSLIRGRNYEGTNPARRAAVYRAD